MLKFCATLLAFAACAVAALAGGDGSLEIKNVRATYGYLGATRPAGGVHPGETVFFTFDVLNLKLDENARASYSMAVEVLDNKNNTVFRLGPRNAIAQNFLGGNSLPSSAHIDIPYDTPPGEYLFRVTVQDRSTKKQATFERKAKLLEHDFALINVGTYADREARVPSSPIGVLGETIFVNFAALDFGRDKKNGQPDLDVTMRILDDKGQATFPKPLQGNVSKDVPESAKIVPLQFALTVNRTGNFTIELEAICKVCGKKSKVTLPLKVVSLNN
ncbi:MAG: hypothetical protein HY040_18200 [Planctomycetes bacterium]|nr:hypothetical protein [Planctomycetota bacterium]